MLEWKIKNLLAEKEDNSMVELIGKNIKRYLIRRYVF